MFSLYLNNLSFCWWTSNVLDTSKLDRVPDELWNDVHDIVQETGIKTIPMEKMQKCKMAVWGGLTNTCEKKRGKKQRRKGKI